jgi:diguanylate cyclase (GGDEF)-like protein/PAS domain S-box-containing protein
VQAACRDEGYAALTLWTELLANLAIVVMTIQIWTSSRQLVPRLGPLSGKLLFGLLFGTSAVIVMQLPFKLADGVYIDLRTALISLPAYFGGPVPALIAGAMAGIARLYAGGAGASTGLAAIVLSGLIGLVVRRIDNSQSPAAVILLAILQSAMVQLAVLAIPGPAGVAAFSTTFPALLLIVFVAVAMGSIAMAQELKWRRLQKMNAIYKTVIDELPDCLNVKDLRGRFVMTNPATAKLMQAPAAEALIGKTDFDFYPHDIAARFRTDEQSVLVSGEPRSFEQPFELPDGKGGWLLTLKSVIRDEHGQTLGLITHNRDVTETRDLQAKYLQAQEKLALAMENMIDGLVSFGPDGRVQFCNGNYRTLFPMTAEIRYPERHYRDIISLSFERGERKLSDGISLEECLAKFEQTLGLAGSLQFELSDGRWIEVQSKPQPDGSCLMTYRDVSQSKHAESALLEANGQLAALATTDGLTGLRNRRAFDQALMAASEESALGTVLLTDIDNFKQYNDIYGHPAGDEVIKAVASCLKKEVDRVKGFSARYGGEELGAILPLYDIDTAFDVAVAFRKAVEALAIPHQGSTHGFVSVSVGISILPDAAPASVGDLLKLADQALYSAKAAGRNAVRAA